MSKEKPAGVEFLIAGLSGIGTGILTNPMDVLKTRLQLQGELSAPGSYQRLYRNTFHAAYLISREEGLLALQSGLLPVLGLQIIVNGVRLGSYHFAKRHGFTTNEAGDTNVAKTALLSGFGGAAAFVIGSPLYLAKIRLQATRSRSSSTWMILSSLWKEDGFKALYRGWNANVPRLFVGSAVQLTTFGLITDSFGTFQAFDERPLLRTFLAAAISGTVLVYSINPFDVMATRLCNQVTSSQGKVALYNGMLDTIGKIIKTEGFSGLFKGTFAHWLRIAPYVVVTQTLYAKIALIYDDFISNE